MSEVSEYTEDARDALVALGAPPLPQGWFYRVASDSFGFARVEIRRDRRIGSKFLASAPVFQGDGDGSPATVEQSIADACERAAAKVDEAKKSARYWSEFRSWEGDHR